MTGEKEEEFKKEINYQYFIDKTPIDDIKKREFKNNSDIGNRYRILNSHLIFGVGFYFGSRLSLKTGNYISSGIQIYYSIFHLTFSLIALDFSIKSKKLDIIRHGSLKSKLEKYSKDGIVNKGFLALFGCSENKELLQLSGCRWRNK